MKFVHKQFFFPLWFCFFLSLRNNLFTCPTFLLLFLVSFSFCFSLFSTLVLVANTIYISTSTFIPTLVAQVGYPLSEPFHNSLPLGVVSDRDTVFTTKLWTEVMRLLDISQDMSMAYHPQTDGQTERVNQVWEQYLSTFCA